MKIDPLNILLKKTFNSNKKFYFISGNEKTLMEKIKSIIIEGYKKKENVQIKNIRYNLLILLMKLGFLEIKIYCCKKL